ncbi:MAG: kelch repeat-containing protein, partial [Actinomycetota bacterium]
VVVADAEKAFDDAAAEAEASGECVTSLPTDGEVVPRCYAIFQSDQAHPNWRGHDVMAQSVIKALLNHADNDFAHRAVPGLPLASDIRTSLPPAVGTIQFSWTPPLLPTGTTLRSVDTYEYAYKPAGNGSWMTGKTSLNAVNLPVPTGLSAPWWIKVRAYSNVGMVGPWSAFGHDSHLVPVEFFEELPHYRENDFIRDRSDMASVWDARDLPNADPSKDCDDGCAYLIGGRGSGNEAVSTDVFRYNPKSNRLTRLGELMLNGLPLKVWGASAIWDGRDIYIIGGYQQTLISDRIVRYNPITGMTSEVAARLPSQAGNSARAWFSAAWDPRVRPGCPEGCAFIFGGTSKLSNGAVFYYDQVLRFDPSSGTISVRNARLPGKVNGSGRCCTSAVFDPIRGLFHLFGGRVPGASSTGAGVIVDDILAYDPVLDAVSIEASLSTPLQFTSSIFDGTNAYVFGGDADGVNILSDRVQRFSPTSFGVTTLGQRLLSGRRLSAAFCDNNEAFILGGDWFRKYTIDHGSGIPSTLIGLASSEALRFSGINKSTSGCEPSAEAYPPLITSPSPGATRGAGGVTLKGVAEQAMTIRLFENGLEVARTSTGQTSEWSTPVTLAGGSHTLTATATDALGRQSLASASLTIVIDNVAPTPPVITSPVEGSVLTSRSVTVVGSAEPTSTVKLMIAGVEAASKVADTAGNWSAAVALAGGANVLSATATDAAGNTSAVSAARNINVQVPIATIEARFGTKRWASAAVWDGRDRPAVGCPGGCSYVFGGDSAGTRLSEIVIYNPIRGQKFSGARLAPGRAGSAVAWTGRYAYLFGGITGSNTYLNTIVRYDSDNDTLTTMRGQLPPDAPGTTLGGRAFASAVWDGRDRPEAGCPGGCAYVFGGYYFEGANRFVNQIVRYNPTTDTTAISTSQLPAGLTPETNARCCSAAAWDSSDSVAYLFGGQRTNASNIIFRFDPTADQLAIVATRLPRTLQIASAVTDGQGNFYVIGGTDSTAGTSDEIIRFKPATGALDVVAFLPERVGGTSAVWTGTSALVFGGQTTGVTITDTILRYTP